MDFDDEEYEQELARTWGWQPSKQEPMRARDTRRVNPTKEDLRLRRRVRRATAGGEMATRDDYLRAAQKATSLSEQARFLDEARKLDDRKRATASQDRELDFADDIVARTLTPVRTHVMHTAATDWLGWAEAPNDENFLHRANAEAAAWFGRTSALVRADEDEFRIQAQGKAQQIAGQFGEDAPKALKTFLAYAEFLRRSEGASGLDQIQQTIDPNNQPKTTPLPTDVFDDFAPEVDPVNAGVTGTETSERNPMFQEIMSGGTGGDPGAPEKPGGHSTTDELSWAPPSGMQADTAPGFSDGDPGTPEKGGDRPKYSSRTQVSPAVAYIGNLDDFRREAARKEAEGLGKCVGCGSTLTMGNAADREGKVCKGCASKSASRKQSASGLDQIDQTVDPNNVPKATGYPGEVAFPLNEEFQGEPTTGGTGNVQSVRPMAKQVQADMYGASDTPHAVPGPPVANTPATTPPLADSAGGASQGRSDASAGNDAPTFADASSAVPAAVNAVGEGYQQQMQQIMEGQPQDVPGSVAGMGSATTHAGSRVSHLLVSAKERLDPDFRKGYGFGSTWTPAYPLVATGSAAFEAGLYAGISDNPAQQRAFVAAQRAGGLEDRADTHKSVTHRVASLNEVPSNGLYLTAATSIELNTTAPNTTPAADGSTPINGRGNPGPLDGVQEAATAGGPSPYNGAQPFGTPVVPGAIPAEPDPADKLTGGGGMSTPAQVQAAFRRRVQATLLAERQGK